MPASRPDTDPESPPPRLTPRLRRILELVYGVEGVLEARVWEWEDGVAVGIRPNATTSANELLSRVESHVIVVREPGETWSFGVLED